MKVWFHNLGCKVNLADGASVFEFLPTEQVSLVKDSGTADVIFLNTCTVTHKADRDVRKILGALGRDHPNVPVVVAGCAAVTMNSILRAFPNVRAIIPPGDPAAVARAIMDGGGKPGDHAVSPFDRLGRKRAIVKVQDGCNAHCAYCVVPRVRGPETSLAIDLVAEKVLRLTQCGYHEVVLSGIHLGRYGINLHPPRTLSQLLQKLADQFPRIGRNHRIRLSSIEPLEWSPSLIERLQEYEFVCRHFHIPLQSGDNGVLEKMNRPYRTEQFVELICELHEKFPTAALGCDLLVGFPGETEQAFENTLNLVTSLPMAYFHVFTFSKRPGTVAEKLPDTLDKLEVRRRNATLRKASNQHWMKFLADGVGERHRVLLERDSPKGTLGRSDNYRPVRVLGGADSLGKIVSAVGRVLDGNILVGERGV